jgi:hypothetical protein
MRRMVLSTFALAAFSLTGCPAADEYCRQFPNDPLCKSYHGTGGTGGNNDAAPPVPDTAPPTPDAAPPYVPVCAPVDGYAITSGGCSGPYVTKSVTPSAGQFLKEEGNTQAYAIVKISSASSAPLVKIALTPDQLLSWSSTYGCNRDCLAIEPPSPNGCTIVTQVTAGALGSIETAAAPIHYRSGSVILVYQGADYVMTPSTTPSWTVHDGDMFVSDPFSLIGTVWRTLHRVPTQEVAAALFPNVTDAVKRTIVATDLPIYGKTQAYDATATNYEPVSICVSDTSRSFDFGHEYPSPSP